MTLKLSTTLAAALLLGASGAAMADSGGPGGKGDATTGTLGVQQRQDADTAREMTGEVSVHNNRTAVRDEAMPVESYGHNRQAAIGYEQERGRPAGGERVEYEVVR